VNLGLTGAQATGAGSDTLSGIENLTGSAFNDTLTGGAGANLLVGGAGDDLLDGGAGDDTMVGGTGDDSYVVGEAGDSVTELAGEGSDTVRASIDYVLGANVEKLVLTGTAANGTGNALDNVITGNTSANVLDGGAGNDTMAGGLGNDLYFVDATGDVVTEALDEGTDTVSSAVDRSLGANLENLILTGAAISGTGNDLANVVTGNGLDNILAGLGGNDSLSGGLGNDSLDGGIGSDSMAGGVGNDLYFVDAIGDSVTELVGEGTDTVSSGIDYALGGNVENLVLTGSALNGTGNGLGNVITGNELANLLSGGDGSDTLNGGAGNDTLNGGIGADAMFGGTGDDLYFVDASGDSVTELGGEGTDTVSSGISYTLGANVENLVLTGSALNGTGNGLDNVITGDALGNRIDGGAGNDRLIGGNGVDFLTGGAGNDVFVGEINLTKTAAKSGPISLDVITDFTAGDKIDLSGLGDFNFKGTSANKGAGDLTYKVYDSVNGAEKALGFDIDGIVGQSTYTGKVTIVSGDIAGGGVDFVIALLNTNSVAATDFRDSGDAIALSSATASGLHSADYSVAVHTFSGTMGSDFLF
jgi:Ca2+-binding RTX toxin-like protein